MRWPGTIQPSRFLSHTGQVMPGVRQVVRTAKPAAGAGWSVNVPAGAMWWIVSGFFALTTGATAGSRYVTINVDLESLGVWSAASQGESAASTTTYYSFTSGLTVPPQSGASNYTTLPLPDFVLPSGSTLSTQIGGVQAGDQMSNCGMYVEEYYFTDAQLSEDARLHAELEHDIAVYEYERAEQTQGGA